MLSDYIAQPRIQSRFTPLTSLTGKTPAMLQLSDPARVVEQVLFLPPSPVHPHIYSNGHVCLDILYDGDPHPLNTTKSSQATF